MVRTTAGSGGYACMMQPSPCSVDVNSPIRPVRGLVLVVRPRCRRWAWWQPLGRDRTTFRPGGQRGAGPTAVATIPFRQGPCQTSPSLTSVTRSGVVAIRVRQRAFSHSRRTHQQRNQPPTPLHYKQHESTHDHDYSVQLPHLQPQCRRNTTGCVALRQCLRPAKLRET